MKIPIELSLSRNSNDVITLKASDPASNIQFLEAQLTLAEFALLITGLSARPAIGELRGLEHVGKSRVREARSVEYPDDLYNSRDEMRRWLLANCQEEGWTVDSYLGSQGSVQRVDGKTVLNYSVFKFVDAEPAP